MISYEAYFDDSGTSPQESYAVAACYISTGRGWKEFVDDWDVLRREEGFDSFHMADFMAPPEQRHAPFCDWSPEKKQRVYGKVTKIINQNKAMGLAIAVPKILYDEIVPGRIREGHGNDHYTFAVSKCLALIAHWREWRAPSYPIQFIFDWESKGKKKEAISTLFGSMDDLASRWIGISDDGFSFQKKAVFKPLQAADVLAWNMNRHIRKIWPGPDEEGLEDEWFRPLRENQEVDLAFLTEKHLKDWVAKIDKWESEHGRIKFWIPQKDDMNAK